MDLATRACAAAAQMLAMFQRSPGRMRRLALTMLPLADEHVGNLAALLKSQQVRRAVG